MGNNWRRLWIDCWRALRPFVSLSEPRFPKGLTPQISKGNRSLTKRWSQLLAASSNRRFEFHKRRQLFIRPHNETLPVVAVRISNPDCPSLRIHG
jgi:hypothetical protein